MEEGFSLTGWFFLNLLHHLHQCKSVCVHSLSVTHTPTGALPSIKTPLSQTTTDEKLDCKTMCGDKCGHTVMYRL